MFENKYLQEGAETNLCRFLSTSFLIEDQNRQRLISYLDIRWKIDYLK
jgi:hypothetical protein